MSEPLIVVIPHRLGKDEALRRIKDGLGRAKTEFAWLLSLEEEVWTGDRLSFRVVGAGSTCIGFHRRVRDGCATRSHIAVAACAVRSGGPTRHWPEGPTDAGEEVSTTSA